MTTGRTEEHDIGKALAELWKQHRASNVDRIEVVEDIAAKIVRGTANEDEVELGVAAAHKLAGSLGTFGFEEGSRIALATESLLQDDRVDGRTLAESVNRLRAAVDSTRAVDDDAAAEHLADWFGAEDPDDQSRPAEQPAGRADDDADIVLFSDDAELAAGLTTASAGTGITCHHHPTAEVLPADGSDAGTAVATPGALVVIDADGATAEQLQPLIEGLASDHTVVALTSAVDFEERLDLTRWGAMATISRSQAPRLTADILARTILGDRRGPLRVTVLGDVPTLVDVLDSIAPMRGHQIDRHADPVALWRSLDGAGSDLIILGRDPGSRSAADICRVIRAEPGYHSIPIAVYDLPDGDDGAEAIRAGADDVMTATATADEMAARLQRIVTRTITLASDTALDRTTGIESRGSAERSLDRLLGSSSRRGETFALARLRFDQLDEIASEHGGVVADLVMRTTAETIGTAVRSTDVFGRWGPNEIVIGFSGAGREAAEQRLGRLLDRLVDQEVTAPSGQPVRCRYRWHLATTPDDGTTLASLDRVGMNALDGVTAGAGSETSSIARHDVDVVVVEDDDSVADVVAYALGLRGYSSARYVDGEQAAEALTAGGVSGRIVLLDVGLPSLDGFGVLDRLGAGGVLDSTHLIMLTARTSEPERLRALDLGATEHMGKPFSVPVLLGRLDQILAGSAS